MRDENFADKFVWEFGLDIDEKGRNLPYIASVDLEKYQALQLEGRL